MSGAYGDGVILDERCSVTAFDLHLRLDHDGGGNQPPGDGRGVWFRMHDHSEARRAMYKKWFENASDRLIAAHPGSGAMCAVLDLSHEMRNLLNSEVDHAVLMEWREVEAIYKALGDVLAARQQILAKGCP